MIFYWVYYTYYRVSALPSILLNLWALNPSTSNLVYRSCTHYWLFILAMRNHKSMQAYYWLQVCIDCDLLPFHTLLTVPSNRLSTGPQGNLKTTKKQTNKSWQKKWPPVWCGYFFLWSSSLWYFQQMNALSSWESYLDFYHNEMHFEYRNDWGIQPWWRCRLLSFFVSCVLV